MKNANSYQHIYILTHCQSCFNKRGIFTGRMDSVLTKKGHDHAEEMAKELKDKEISVAYRSSLTRTKETLDHILAYHPNTKVFVDDRIIERDYGELSGKSKEKYKREHPKIYPVYHRSYDVPPPGGESIKDVEKRVLPFVHEVIRKMKKEKINVLVVAHGNSIRPMIRFFEELTPKQMMNMEHFRHKIFTYTIDVS